MIFVRGLYGGQQVRDLLLEEVELSSDERFWLITIGFSLATEGDSPLIITASRPQLARHYKVVKVDAESGSPVSLKIREVAEV